MFDSLRKPGSFLVKTGAVIGGAYAVRGYMRERLEEVKDKIEEERRARETLKTRFTQTHEDIAYSILALLPTLSSQVLHEMDIDSLTRELQTRSRARHSRTEPSSLASSIVSVAPYPPVPYPASVSDADTEAPSEARYTQSASSVYHTAESASFVSDNGSVTQSWVVDSSRSRSPAAASVVSSVDGARSSVSGDHMSESIISTATNTTTSSDTTDTRTKAELWNEVKILTFTRTLTTLYSTTLLCLLTTLQLTLLARGKYITSIMELEKQQRYEERMQAHMSRQLSPASIILQGVTTMVSNMLGRGGGPSKGGIEDLIAGLGLDENFEMDKDEDDAPEEAQFFGDKPGYPGVWMGEINEEIESKYLTMSWWLLHVGWKDVGERVRRAVEEVFNGVSLKTKLSSLDLHRLLEDVRRLVEQEFTFEGTERKINFTSSLLPPTPETIHHVLTQGGYSSALGSLSSDYDTDVLNLHRPPHQRKHAHAQPLHHHHRNASATSMTTSSSASMGVDSSQLSHSFVDSPALAISAHPGPAHDDDNADPHAQYPRYPRRPPPATNDIDADADPADAPSHSNSKPNPTTTTYLPPPPPTQYALLDAPFVALIEETRAILASPDFACVLEAALARAADVLYDGVERSVFGLGRDGEARSGVQTEEEMERVRLAGLLPGLARWSQLALDGLPNELVDSILNLRQVSCLSAIAFSRFEERFQ